MARKLQGQPDLPLTPIPEASAKEKLKDEQRFREFMAKLEANEREIWLRKEKLQDNKGRQDALTAELEALKADEATLNGEIEQFQEDSLSTYYQKVSMVRSYLKRAAPAQVALAERLVQPELLPALKPICGCESAGSPHKEPRHYEADGSVRRNPKTPDWGYCQINDTTWKRTSQQLGFDYMTPNGNIVMSNIIFAVHGAAPWSATAACHGNRSTVASL